MAPDAHKAMVVAGAAADIIYSPMFTGTHGKLSGPIDRCCRYRSGRGSLRPAAAHGSHGAGIEAQGVEAKSAAPGRESVRSIRFRPLMKSSIGSIANAGRPLR